jgi:peroxiredoxin
MSNEHPQKRTPSIGLWILLAGGLVLGVIMAMMTVAWNSPSSTSQASESGLISITEPASTGQLAPDFSASTPDGKTLSLADLAGSAVALNFWATWCAPCQSEMPELQSTADRYAAQGLIVLGVDASESADQVKDYMAELRLTFPTVIDPDGRIANQYGVYAFPTTIWIDEKGAIRARHLGPLTREDIDRYVANVLGE